MLRKCKKFKLTEDDRQINITAIAVGGKRKRKKERERERERRCNRVGALGDSYDRLTFVRGTPSWMKRCTREWRNGTQCNDSAATRCNILTSPYLRFSSPLPIYSLLLRCSSLLCFPLPLSRCTLSPGLAHLVALSASFPSNSFLFSLLHCRQRASPSATLPPSPDARRS